MRPSENEMKRKESPFHSAPRRMDFQEGRNKVRRMDHSKSTGQTTIADSKNDLRQLATHKTRGLADSYSPEELKPANRNQQKQ